MKVINYLRSFDTTPKWFFVVGIPFLVFVWGLATGAWRGYFDEGEFMLCLFAFLALVVTYWAFFGLRKADGNTEE